MPEIVTEHYTAKPSDNRKWVLIQSPAGKTVDVEIRVLNYHYDCVPKPIDYNGNKIPCSYLCCYCGCYCDEGEIKRIKDMMDGIISLLPEDAQKLLAETHGEIHVPYDYDEVEKLWKLRAAPAEWKTAENINKPDNKEERKEEIIDKPEELEKKPANRCVFLMENGLCAIHKYCNDTGRNWVKEKCNICVTFPLDIRPQDNTIAFMNSFDSFTFATVDCISTDEDRKESLGMGQIIETMKYAIVDRYTEEWWEALNHFAHDYREGKIDFEYIFRDLPKKVSKKNTTGEKPSI
jgi:hypothetical protein